MLYLSFNKWAGMNLWMDKNYYSQNGIKKNKPERSTHIEKKTTKNNNNNNNEAISDAWHQATWWSCLKWKNHRQHWNWKKPHYLVRTWNFNIFNGNMVCYCISIYARIRQLSRWALIHKNFNWLIPGSIMKMNDTVIRCVKKEFHIHKQHVDVSYDRFKLKQRNEREKKQQQVQWK